MKKIKLSAFTLMEALVSLLVLAGSVLILSGLSKLFHSEMLNSQRNIQQDWQLFCHLLRKELAEARFDKVEDNYLYVFKKSHLKFGLATAGDFRKSHANGRGYQPLLHGLKGTTIREEKGQVQITVTFERGEERTFLYKFSKE